MKYEVCVNSYGKYTVGDVMGLWVELGREWEDLIEELIDNGFDLEGKDEELFIIDDNGLGCGEAHPYEVNKVLYNIEDYEVSMFLACVEALSFNEVCELVNNDSFEDVIFYEDMELIDVAYEIADEFLDSNNCPDLMSRYFDYEAFARDLSFDGYIETKYGVVLLP